MRKITLVILAAVLATATAAQAQMQGGGGSGGRGHGGGRHGGGKSGPPPVATADDAPAPRPAALNQIVIVGVVRSLDLAAERVTISYDAVDQLGWPAGVMPFALGKPGLLSDVKVGQKVRFRLENQRIVEIGPFAASQAAVAGGEPRPVPGT
jgi:Cu/Ag efflux protein CusF